MNKKKSLLVAFAVMMVASIGSAALIDYYGRITATVTVEQSVVLIGDGIDVIPETAPGGEEFCFAHTLQNNASVPGTVSFASTINDETEVEGITTCQAEKLYEVLADEDMTKYQTAPEVIEISKTWECGNVIWDIEIAESNYHNTEFGLVIADSPDKAEFQVASHSGGQIIYQECDGGPDLTYGCWAGGSGQTQDLPDGIIVTTSSGTPPHKFHIEIPLKYLPVEDCDDSFYWAVVVRTNAGWALYPHNWDMWSGAGTYAENVLKESLSDPLELESGETKDFCNCYDFDFAIEPGQYTIVTDVIPV